MKAILLTIAFLTSSLLAYSQLDTRATVKTQGLVANIYLLAESAYNYPPSPTNGISANVAFSLPANGETDPENAPSIVSVTFGLTGIAINTQSVGIWNDRFVYTFLINGQTGAIMWPAGSENLLMSITFNEDVSGDHPRLDNLFVDGDGNSYFYFEVNGQQRSDTEGTPFYNGIIGSYPSSDIYVESITALPVTLVSFDAEKHQTRSSLLSWSTASEINSSHFLVQRSSDKKEWKTVGKVNAAGESQIIRNYSFVDENVYNGFDASLMVYYRLMSVDLDGQTKGSPIESVVFGNSDIAKGRNFIAYPNPASDGIHVAWNGDIADQPTDIEFYDTNGKQVFTHKVGENSHEEYVDFTRSNLQAGLYLMRVMSGDEPVEFKQIVIGQN